MLKAHLKTCIIFNNDNDIALISYGPVVGTLLATRIHTQERMIGYTMVGTGRKTGHSRRIFFSASITIKPLHIVRLATCWWLEYNKRRSHCTFELRRLWREKKQKAIWIWGKALIISARQVLCCHPIVTIILLYSVFEGDYSLAICGHSKDKGVFQQCFSFGL